MHFKKIMPQQFYWRAFATLWRVLTLNQDHLGFFFWKCNKSLLLKHSALHKVNKRIRKWITDYINNIRLDGCEDVPEVKVSKYLNTFTQHIHKCTTSVQYKCTLYTGCTQGQWIKMIDNTIPGLTAVRTSQKSKPEVSRYSNMLTRYSDGTSVTGSRVFIVRMTYTQLCWSTPISTQPVAHRVRIMYTQSVHWLYTPQW